MTYDCDSLLNFSTLQVEKIINSSPNIQNANTESLFLFTKAAELFVEFLATSSHIENDLDYNSLSTYIHKDKRLGFLKDIIPQKITIAEYKTMQKSMTEKMT